MKKQHRLYRLVGFVGNVGLDKIYLIKPLFVDRINKTELTEGLNSIMYCAITNETGKTITDLMLRLNFTHKRPCDKDMHKLHCETPFKQGDVLPVYSNFSDISCNWRLNIDELLNILISFEDGTIKWAGWKSLETRSEQFTLKNINGILKMENTEKTENTGNAE